MNIKLTKAKNLAETGRYHQTWRSIMDAMPTELKSRCTAFEIALIADAMRAQHLCGQSSVSNDCEVSTQEWTVGEAAEIFGPAVLGMVQNKETGILGADGKGETWMIEEGRVYIDMDIQP